MTRSRPSVSATDAESVVGAILNRYRIAQGWNTESPEDHALRVASWLEILGIAEIPVAEYDDLYRRATRTRMRREAAGEKVFNLSPGELVAEYRVKQTRAAEQDAAVDQPDRVLTCPDRHEHRTPDEAIRDYGFPGEAEEWLPCHVCRPRAFRQRKAERSAERAEKTRQTVRGMLAAGAPFPPLSELDQEIDAICEKMRRDPADPELQQQYRGAIERKAKERGAK